MDSTEKQIRQLEEELRLAELAPDPAFFRKHLDDEMVFVGDGKVSQPKEMIIEAHTPGKGQKFDRVEMTNMKVVSHGESAVVTCSGTFQGAKGSHHLNFMRLWVRKGDDWKIVAASMF